MVMFSSLGLISDLVMVVNSGEQGTLSSLTLCQVKHSLTSQELEVVWWVEADTLLLCPLAFKNLLRRNSHEVFVDPKSVIHHNDVIYMAFLFSVDIFEQLQLTLLG